MWVLTVQFANWVAILGSPPCYSWAQAPGSIAHPNNRNAGGSLRHRSLCTKQSFTACCIAALPVFSVPVYGSYWIWHTSFFPNTPVLPYDVDKRSKVQKLRLHSATKIIAVASESSETWTESIDTIISFIREIFARHLNASVEAVISILSLEAAISYASVCAVPTVPMALTAAMIHQRKS